MRQIFQGIKLSNVLIKGVIAVYFVSVSRIPVYHQSSMFIQDILLCKKKNKKQKAKEQNKHGLVKEELLAKLSCLVFGMTKVYASKGFSDGDSEIYIFLIENIHGHVG